MTPLVTLDDYERAARERFEPADWEYVHGGAADEYTMRWNRNAFARIRLAPRMLRDVATIDTRVHVLGHDLAHPVMLAPVAAHVLAHPDAEVGTARGAHAAGAGMVLSSYTSRTVEQVVATGVSPLWFQLYIQERAATEQLLATAVAAGASAVVVTVDTPTSGARDRQARAGFDWPQGLPYRTVEPGDNPCTWDDIAWIRRAVNVPVVLKGILRADDAELAVQNGAHALVVSNHGARNLDTVPASIDALTRVVDAVAGRIPVLFDGGVRRGTDVLKALALGASAVMIGRPYVYGLAVDGAAGVTSVIDILTRELRQAMMLCGVNRVSAITPDLIWKDA